MSEIVQMVKDLTEMSEENFQECIHYAQNMETSEHVKDFLNALIATALVERQKKTIQTA